MAPTPNKIEVYLEIGKNRTFAGAIDWPGWSRSARDEAPALQALFDYAPRYAHTIRSAGLEFLAPAGTDAFVVIERLGGNATTDFGSPGAAPSADAQPVAEAELQHFRALLQACWRMFDATAKKAAGQELRRGPRGGGRELDEIVRHVADAEAAYLTQLGGKREESEEATPAQERSRLRQAILSTLAQAAHGEIPARGPRGGLRWTPRYFVRRTAWHVLDHAWEIEDRVP